jgi:tRNA 2-selenouridine synthase
MTWRELEAENLQKLRKAVIVDVRSPCEYDAERIPQAINIPLLTDGEREQVGIVYAQQGEIAARRLGLTIISPKIPSIVDQIVELRKQDTALVVHCWRGGLRSESVASFLSIVGIDCWRLKGGYKAWRRLVLDDFARDAYTFQTVVLHGRTGTGKTEILARLAAQGLQVVDLEELSGHRGSLFGSLGLSAQPTQKNFEGRLWQQINSLTSGPVFVEAESRKLGKLSMPDCIMRRIETGRRILVTDTMPGRVSRLIACYLPQKNKTVASEAMKLLSTLTDSLGKKAVAGLGQLAADGDYNRLVAQLLEVYYDPHYDKHISKQQPFELEVSGDDADKAAEDILTWSRRQVLS